MCNKGICKHNFEGAVDGRAKIREAADTPGHDTLKKTLELKKVPQDVRQHFESAAFLQLRHSTVSEGDKN
jgi:hypothetical protein